MTTRSSSVPFFSRKSFLYLTGATILLLIVLYVTQAEKVLDIDFESYGPPPTNVQIGMNVTNDSKDFLGVTNILITKKIQDEFADGGVIVTLSPEMDLGTSTPPFLGVTLQLPEVLKIGDDFSAPENRFDWEGWTKYLYDAKPIMTGLLVSLQNESDLTKKKHLIETAFGIDQIVTGFFMSHRGQQIDRALVAPFNELLEAMNHFSDYLESAPDIEIEYLDDGGFNLLFPDQLN